MSFREDLIYLPALLMDMSTGSATLGVAFFASRLGASSLVIGTMASVSTLLYVLFCQVFGRLSDRVNRKRFPQLACLSLSVLYFLIPFCRRLEQLVVFFPFTGIALAAVWPALEAWIGERGDSRPLLKRVMMFNLFWTSGLMIGYVGGGYIGYMGGLEVRTPFYFSSIAAICAAAAITVQPNSDIRIRGVKYEEAAESHVLSQQMATRYLYISRFANLFSYLTLGIVRYLFPKFIDQMTGELGIALRTAPLLSGVLMLCQAGTQFLMFLMLGATERWHYKFAPLAICQMLASFGFLSIWLSNSPVLWAFGLMIIGFNIGMTYFSSIYYSLCGGADLGSQSGWHESILHSGSLMSTLIGGALANYTGTRSPYLFCAATAIVGLPIQVLILRRRY